MIYKGLYLHGIDEIVRVGEDEIFSRFPQSLNEQIAHNTAYQMSSVEIRFVLTGRVVITLGSRSIDMQAKCLIYHGDFGDPEEYIIQGERTFVLEPHKKFDHVIETEIFEKKDSNFSFDVIRMLLQGENFYIKHVEGSYHLALEEQMPKKRMLSYGTSITQGIGASSPDIFYPWQLARKLGYDSYNYALSGNCLCEREVSDYLVKETYDLITLEVSVNMLALGYSIDEFEKRITYLLRILRKKNPKIPILCLVSYLFGLI